MHKHILFISQCFPQRQTWKREQRSILNMNFCAHTRALATTAYIARHWTMIAKNRLTFPFLLLSTLSTVLLLNLTTHTILRRNNINPWRKKNQMFKRTHPACTRYTCTMNRSITVVAFSESHIHDALMRILESNNFDNCSNWPCYSCKTLLT